MFVLTKFDAISDMTKGIVSLPISLVIPSPSQLSIAEPRVRSARRLQLLTSSRLTRRPYPKRNLIAIEISLHLAPGRPYCILCNWRLLLKVVIAYSLASMEESDIIEVGS
jgi:hypothetical protein